MSSTTEELNKYVQSLDAPVDEDLEAKPNMPTLSLKEPSNIVSKKALRKVQVSILNDISAALTKTYGPMGSNTIILKGNSKESLVVNYSKDGRKVLDAITYQNPIEMAIQEEISSIAHDVDKEVGDATTSSIILSSNIFNKLCLLDDYASKYDYTPYMMTRAFQLVAKEMQKAIKDQSKEFTEDNVYDLTMISTNGNKHLATSMQEIYKQFGMDVYIDVAISNNKDDEVKINDGLTLDEGYSSPSYINTMEGTSRIEKAHVYCFADPVDQPDLINLFEKIVYTNVMEPSANGGEVKPTVILAPKFSRDLSNLMGNVESYLLSFDQQGIVTQKPPLLVVTNFIHQDEMLDIARLCGTKVIRRYVNEEIQKADEEKGDAATIDNVCSFDGLCEVVEADIATTKFVRPNLMYKKDDNGNLLYDENGDMIPTATFASLLSFLTAALNNAEKEGTLKEQHDIRVRLQSLKANMVEYKVGGIDISDRDVVKDLVEDAVKNCRSAAKNGIGYAANFEGFRAISNILETYENNKDYQNDLIKELSNTTNDGIMLKLIMQAILYSYFDATVLLYNSAMNEDKAREIAIKSLSEAMPLNLMTNSFDGKVITSIATDIEVIDAISRIVTNMYSANQALVQVPSLNIYTE